MPRNRIRYSIRDWDENFENAASRKVKRPAWVPIRNHHDGKSFRRLISMENGAALYGAWVLILQVASKCPERGVLADSDGPLDADDLAAKTGCPAELFEQAFEVLSSPRIGWLDAEPTDSSGSVLPEPAAIPGEPDAISGQPDAIAGQPDAIPGQNRTGQNGIEKEVKGTTQKAADAGVVLAKSKKRPSKNQKPVQMPDELDTDAARTALDEFREHRRQMRKPLTAMAEAKLLKEWSAKGAGRFVAAVNHSISNCWQGVFESENGSAKQASRIEPPAGKYDDDSDIVDLTDGEQA